MQLKRLWDTDGKKIVFTEGPTGHQCQVWTDESGNLYIYDMAQWLAYNGTTPEGKEYDRSNWVVLTDQTVGFYDTDKPIELYNRDHGDKAYYQFVDWDGTVLKSGTVTEGQTPEAPEDPTRPDTAQYSYTFEGWNPEVGPIKRRTTFTATYEATLKEYEVTVQAEEGGTVDDVHFTFPYGTAVSAEENVLTFGTGEDAVVVTATPDSGYEFVEWTAEEQPEPPRGATRSAKGTKTAVRGTLPSMITGAITFKAVFQVEVPNEALIEDDGKIDPLDLTVALFTTDIESLDYVNLCPAGSPGGGVTCLPEGVYADERLEIDGDNVFETLFSGMSLSYLTALAQSGTTGDTGTIISAFFTALKNLFNNPTAENLATAEALLAGYEADDPQTMFVNWAPTTYTVTIQSNNTSYGTVDESELTVDAGTTLSAVSNVLSVGATDVTATAETGYEFVSWTCSGSTIPATVTDDITITATFQAESPTPIIPDTYQQVQYIQNTGEEYISTGLGAIYNSTEVEVDFEVLTHTSNTETFIYAVWDDGGFRAGPIDDNWTTTFGFTYDPSTYATNTRTVATGTSGLTTSNIAYIFGQGEGASVTHYDTGTMKLYSLVIKESNVVVRNFIPCYIKATNEVGLYDTVSETFYGNASGNGALVAGPNAN